MPKPIYRKNLEAVIASQWAEFEDPTAWRESAKGNLWREYQGVTVTVFRRNDETWGWCVADSEGQTFSPESYDTIADATTALGETLGVNEL